MQGWNELVGRRSIFHLIVYLNNFTEQQQHRLQSFVRSLESVQCSLCHGQLATLLHVT